MGFYSKCLTIFIFIWLTLVVLTHPASLNDQGARVSVTRRVDIIQQIRIATEKR